MLTVIGRVFSCCRTALAEAEIEYNDSYCSPSVYVKYNLEKLSDALYQLGKTTYRPIRALMHHSRDLFLYAKP